jgi:hypothetical protein
VIKGSGTSIRWATVVLCSRPALDLDQTSSGALLAYDHGQFTTEEAISMTQVPVHGRDSVVEGKRGLMMSTVVIAFTIMALGLLFGLVSMPYRLLDPLSEG